MSSSRDISVQQVSEYTGHTGSIFALAVDAYEVYAYTSGDDGIIVQWDLYRPNSDGNGLFRIERSVYALAVAEEHQLVIAGTSDGPLYAYHLSQKKLVFTSRKHTGAIYDLWVDRERSLLWVLHAEGVLWVMSLPDFEEKGYLRPSQAHLRSIYPDPDEQHLYLASSDHQIHVLDSVSGQIAYKWKAHENSVFALNIHQGAKYLLSGGRDAHLCVWDLQQQYQPVKRIPAHNFTINGIALSPQEDYFVTASRDKTIKLWDAYSFDLLKVVDFARHKGHKHSVNRVRWLERDQTVLSCGDDRRLLRWKFDIT